MNSLNKRKHPNRYKRRQQDKREVQGKGGKAKVASKSRSSSKPGGGSSNWSLDYEPIGDFDPSTWVNPMEHSYNAALANTARLGADTQAYNTDLTNQTMAAIPGIWNQAGQAINTSAANLGATMAQATPGYGAMDPYAAAAYSATTGAALGNMASDASRAVNYGAGMGTSIGFAGQETGRALNEDNAAAQRGLTAKYLDQAPDPQDIFQMNMDARAQDLEAQRDARDFAYQAAQNKKESRLAADAEKAKALQMAAKKAHLKRVREREAEAEAEDNGKGGKPGGGGGKPDGPITLNTGVGLKLGLTGKPPSSYGKGKIAGKVLGRTTGNKKVGKSPAASLKLGLGSPKLTAGPVGGADDAQLYYLSLTNPDDPRLDTPRARRIAEKVKAIETMGVGNWQQIYQLLSLQPDEFDSYGMKARDEFYGLGSGGSGAY